jgi:murein DD-endopeptidase MepM/ murein hydrolase activator NlpD
MKKVKYFYNTHTLRYEKLEVPLRVKLLRILAFLATALVTSAIISYFAFQFVGSPNEKLLRQENETLRQRYGILDEKIKGLQLQMNELEKRDNNTYRALFEATPLPDSARLKAKEQKDELQLVQGMNDMALTESIARTLTQLGNRIAVQNSSFTEIEGLIKNKEAFLAHIPAIQPVSNKDLSRIASGYGMRVDPVYKTIKMHKGLDFTAPQGTPIYATADGTIREASFSSGGYGNHVIIDHGFSYETLYGHMVRIKVSAGQSVKRGEVIGWVGSTGKSTGPHCHYEVHKNGEAIDPIYFFYNDLNAEQYDRLLKMVNGANKINQSAD